MLDLDYYRGPGRKQKLTRVSAAVIFALTLIMGGIIGFSFYLAAFSRTTVVRLDPYLKVYIRGADSFAEVTAEFDREGFAKQLEGILSEIHPGEQMTAEELHSLADTVAESVSTDYILERNRKKNSVESSAGSEGKGSEGKASDTESTESTQNTEKTESISGNGISNGDKVYCYAYMEEEAQDLLREKGFVLAFESGKVIRTAEGLPEAEPYDPFTDLTVEFEGISGNGRVILTYKGSLPLTFQAEPAKGLSNGDTVRICMAPAKKYTIDQIAGEYHIVPTDSESSYEVSGLFFEPASIHAFSEEILNRLKEVGREKARTLLEEEYFQDEKLISLTDSGLFYAAKPVETDTGDADDNYPNDDEGERESGQTGSYSRVTEKGIKDNFLFCTYLVHYADKSGNQLEYYYYVRFENVLINDQDQFYADFDQAAVPQKSTSLWRGLLGEDSTVTVPGFLNFRTLAGYETLQGLQDAITEDLDSGYGITQMI